MRELLAERQALVGSLVCLVRISEHPKNCGADTIGACLRGMSIEMDVVMMHLRPVDFQSSIDML